MHVLFPVDAPPISAEALEAALTEATSLLAEAQSLFTARRRPAHDRRGPDAALTLAVDPDALPLLRPGDGREPARAAAGAASPAPAPGAGRAMTKQSQTREQRARPDRAAEVGEAIPSERQLSSDLGVSRLTVRAALDDLVREGTSCAAAAPARS